mmetsp:Transcript_3742/g.11096  ORF Transcript_3742/g.11096 Transcript_3742/m.11096 type:complete len:553 (+) Transcript_3742:37-1695(+)
MLNAAALVTCCLGATPGPSIGFSQKLRTILRPETSPVQRSFLLLDVIRSLPEETDSALSEVLGTSPQALREVRDQVVLDFMPDAVFSLLSDGASPQAAARGPGTALSPLEQLPPLESMAAGFLVDDEVDLTQPPYELMATHGDFEVRRYDAYVITRLPMDVAARVAENKGFAALVSHVFSHANASRVDLVNALPIETRARADGSSSLDVAFHVGPKGSFLPAPLPEGVEVVEVPSRVCAVYSFNGFATRGAVGRAYKALLTSMATRDLRPSFEAKIEGAVLQYSTPQTLPHKRRNVLCLDLHADDVTRLELAGANSPSRGRRGMFGRRKDKAASDDEKAPMSPRSRAFLKRVMEKANAAAMEEARAAEAAHMGVQQTTATPPPPTAAQETRTRSSASATAADATPGVASSRPASSADCAHASASRQTPSAFQTPQAPDVARPLAPSSRTPEPSQEQEQLARAPDSFEDNVAPYPVNTETEEEKDDDFEFMPVRTQRTTELPPPTPAVGLTTVLFPGAPATRTDQYGKFLPVRRTKQQEEENDARSGKSYFTW